jgi:hypothetical protein
VCFRGVIGCNVGGRGHEGFIAGTHIDWDVHVEGEM